MATQANTADKPRLTDAQKKENHIASEQKRRQAIRENFDRLAEIVPGMEGQGRSEAVVLAATVEYLRAELTVKEQLCEEMRRREPMGEARIEEVYRQQGDGAGGGDVKEEGR